MLASYLTKLRDKFREAWAQRDGNALYVRALSIYNLCGQYCNVRKVAIALGVLAVFIWVGAEFIFDEGNTHEVLRPVLTRQLLYNRSTNIKDLAGVSKAEQVIALSFRTSGMINMLPISIGDKIEFGQLVAGLDDRDHRDRLHAARAELNKAHANYANAHSQYDRIRELAAKDVASQSELDIATAAAKNADAEVRRATSALELAERELLYTSLIFTQQGAHQYRACFVSDKLAEVHENVSQGRPIATVECFDRLEIDVGVPEAYISNIQKGDIVSVRFNTAPESVYSGVVRELGISARGGAVYVVTVALDSDNTKELRPGMSANVSFGVSKHGKDRTLVVPFHAISGDSRGKFLYLFEKLPDSKKLSGRAGSNLGVARKKYVKVTSSVSDGFVVGDGVDAGDVVITAGVRYLHDGRRVARYDDINGITQ